MPCGTNKEGIYMDFMRTFTVIFEQELHILSIIIYNSSSCDHCHCKINNDYIVSSA